MPRLMTAAILASLILLLPAALTEARLLDLYVDGRPMQAAPPARAAGTPVVPVRTLAGALGAAVGWDERARRVDLNWNGQAAAFWIGGDAAFVNGRRYPLQVSPWIEDGRALIPVRPLADGLGLQLTWSESRGWVMLNRPGQPLEVRHTVQRGDTLWLLGQRFLSSPAAIQHRNGLSSEALDLGQALSVPVQVPVHDAADPLLGPGFVFPFPAGARYSPFVDDFGASRTWSPDGPVQDSHDGVDIMAPGGEPLVAVGNGTVIRHGWSQYGGYRLTIQLDDAPYRAYYAHLSAYAPGMAVGVRVKRGQLIGYVGSTGYGPEPTWGKFDPHLHFGLYDASFEPINPYPYLVRWEERKVRLP